jgi:predicted nucleic acid-binding protein
MLVVSDTSPVSTLFAIGKLGLLRDLFGVVVIPSMVLAELSRLKEFGYDISEIEEAHWLIVHTAQDTTAVKNLSNQLDPGESEAIVLAQELRADFLLIDERKGRKVANTLGFKTVGVLGILLEAKKQKLVFEVAPLLDEIQNVAGFYLGESLRREVLLLAGE